VSGKNKMKGEIKLNKRRVVGMASRKLKIQNYKITQGWIVGKARRPRDIMSYHSCRDGSCSNKSGEIISEKKKKETRKPKHLKK
jgi:hypothetical protein